MIQTLKWCPRGDLTQSLNSSISHIIFPPADDSPTLFNVNVNLQSPLHIFFSHSYDLTATVYH
jgi:hypothetical protein